MLAIARECRAGRLSGRDCRGRVGSAALRRACSAPRRSASPTRGGPTADPPRRRLDRRLSRPRWPRPSTRTQPTWSCWPASCACCPPQFVARYAGRIAEHPPLAAARCTRDCTPTGGCSPPAMREHGASVHYRNRGAGRRPGRSCRRGCRCCRGTTSTEPRGAGASAGSTASIRWPSAGLPQGRLRWTGRQAARWTAIEARPRPLLD